MQAPLFNAKYSIRNAERHIEAVIAELRKFDESCNYAHVTEPHAESGGVVHKLKPTILVPEFLSGMVFDVIINLRSALDQLGHTVAVAAGFGPKPNYAGFPFGDSETDLKSREGGACKQIPKVIFDYLASYKPYKGGDDVLWSLNKIANSHKHHFIVKSAGIANVSLMWDIYIKSGRDFNFPPKWDPDKDEMVFGVTPEASDFNGQVQITTTVSLFQSDAGIAYPVHPYLATAAKRVTQIVTGVEEKAREIGLALGA